MLGSSVEQKQADLLRQARECDELLDLMGLGEPSISYWNRRIKPEVQKLEPTFQFIVNIKNQILQKNSDEKLKGIIEDLKKEASILHMRAALPMYDSATYEERQILNDFAQKVGSVMMFEQNKYLISYAENELKAQGFGDQGESKTLYRKEDNCVYILQTKSTSCLGVDLTTQTAISSITDRFEKLLTLPVFEVLDLFDEKEEPKEIHLIIPHIRRTHWYTIEMKIDLYNKKTQIILHDPYGGGNTRDFDGKYVAPKLSDDQDVKEVENLLKHVIESNLKEVLGEMEFEYPYSKYSDFPRQKGRCICSLVQAEDALLLFQGKPLDDRGRYYSKTGVDVHMRFLQYCIEHGLDHQFIGSEYNEIIQTPVDKVVEIVKRYMPAKQAPGIIRQISSVEKMPVRDTYCSKATAMRQLKPFEIMVPLRNENDRVVGDALNIYISLNDKYSDFKEKIYEAHSIKVDEYTFFFKKEEITVITYNDIIKKIQYESQSGGNPVVSLRLKDIKLTQEGPQSSGIAVPQADATFSDARGTARAVASKDRFTVDILLPNNKKYSIDVSKKDTILNLKNKIEEKTGIDVNVQKLSCNKTFKFLEDNMLIKDTGLSDASSISLHEARTFTVEVKDFLGVKGEFKISSNETILDLKQKIRDARSFGIDNDEISLIHKGKELQDDSYITDNNIIIYLVQKLPTSQEGLQHQGSTASYGEFKPTAPLDDEQPSTSSGTWNDPKQKYSDIEGMLTQYIHCINPIRNDLEIVKTYLNQLKQIPRAHAPSNVEEVNNALGRLSGFFQDKDNSVVVPEIKNHINGISIRPENGTLDNALLKTSPEFIDEGVSSIISVAENYCKAVERLQAALPLYLELSGDEKQKLEKFLNSSPKFSALNEYVVQKVLEQGNGRYRKTGIKDDESIYKHEHGILTIYSPTTVDDGSTTNFQKKLTEYIKYKDQIKGKDINKIRIITPFQVHYSDSGNINYYTLDITIDLKKKKTEIIVHDPIFDGNTIDHFSELSGKADLKQIIETTISKELNPGAFASLFGKGKKMEFEYRDSPYYKFETNSINAASLITARDQIQLLEGVGIKRDYLRNCFDLYIQTLIYCMDHEINCVDVNLEIIEIINKCRGISNQRPNPFYVVPTAPGANGQTQPFLEKGPIVNGDYQPDHHHQIRDVPSGSPPTYEEATKQGLYSPLNNVAVGTSLGQGNASSATNLNKNNSSYFKIGGTIGGLGTIVSGVCAYALDGLRNKIIAGITTLFCAIIAIACLVSLYKTTSRLNEASLEGVDQGRKRDFN